jgi:dTDP-4-dehydrorhamnose reductase
MKVLLAGANGQIGRALAKNAPAGMQLLALGHGELDITDENAICRVLNSFGPEVVINAAAYTAVDEAEREAELAALVNATGPRLLAEEVGRRPGCRIVHLSTDFVFDGVSSEAYLPQATPNPQSVYGRTKFAGERMVMETLPARSSVLRTSWVYASVGQNFLLTMLRMMRESGVVRVVDDQIGSPTAAASVSRAIWRLASEPHLQGIYHWTDAGVASWYDFAVAIAERGLALRLLSTMPEVIPIASTDYPYAARRPPFSVLDKRLTSRAFGLQPVHWQRSLGDVMTELAGQ